MESRSENYSGESRAVNTTSRHTNYSTSSESRSSLGNSSESRSSLSNSSESSQLHYTYSEVSKSPTEVTSTKEEVMSFDTIGIASPLKNVNKTSERYNPMKGIDKVLNDYEYKSNQASGHHLSDLHSNQKLLLAEMVARGIDVEIIDFDKEIVKATYQGHEELLYDRDSSIVPYNLSVITGNKWLAKKLLDSKGISVASGAAFSSGANTDTLEYLFGLVKSPVVVKPTFGSHGENICFNIKTVEEFITTVRNLHGIYGKNTQLLAEEQFEGKEYRIFITKNGDYAVLEREPAYIVGDDVHTIKELVQIENESRMQHRDFSVCPILLDEEAEKYLKEQGISTGSDYVLASGVKRYVRPNSNVATGGFAIDRTKDTHPTVIEIAKKILDTFQGLPYIGIDFMTNDISEEQSEGSYRVIEVNTVPGLDIHFRPYKGTSRNVAKFMVDLIYPETIGNVKSTSGNTIIFHEVEKGCHCKLGDHQVLVLHDTGCFDYHSSDTLYSGLCPICQKRIEDTTESGWRYLVINPTNNKGILPIMYTDLSCYIEFEKEYTEEELLYILVDVYDPDYISYGKKTLYSRSKGILEQN